MAGGVRSNSNNLGLGLKEIPMGSRKMVLSLKEIVNCPEAEIYAMLKDCNMDPNEAVNRLLSQDPFHEVKSKREKKKENKDTSEGRSRGSSSSSNRGGRSGTNRYPRDGYSGSTATAYNPDFGATQAKPAYKKDNGPASASYTGYGGGSGYTSTYKQPPVSEAATYTENKVSVVGKSEGVSTQQYQSSGWGGVPGQLSMADIVKMGKPQNRAPPHHQQHNVDDWGSVPQQQHGSGSMNDEWPLMEPTSIPTSTTVNVSELTSLDDTKLHQDSASSTLQYDNSSWHDQPDEIQAVDDIAVAADESVHEDNYDDNNNDNASYQTEHDEVEEEVDASESSVTENMQQLNIVEEIESGGDLPSVVIPNHLQVQTADCSHLSFGSFRVGAPISAPLTSAPVEESAASEPDALVVDHSEPRNSEYYGEEQFRNAATDGSLFHRAGENSANYDSPSSASQQQEGLKTENPVVIEHGNQYAYPSTTPGGYTFENNNQQQQQQAMYNQAQSQSQSQQEHAQFSNVMQGYTNSPLAANVHPGRESEIQYSPFAINQSMPAKYGNSSGSAISMPEALRTVGLSSGQPITGANVATGPGLPQQLLHPYSQHNIGLSPYSNMISYPFIHHPTYPYMPNAFQQAFPNNSSYHPQSLSGILPQYKNSGASVSSVQPQSATVPSGYGAFANTTTIPGNFPPSAQSAAAIGYEELLNSQYKENSHLMSLQQQQVNENSAMWHQGSGSRSMSGVPGSTYYNLQGQGQNQQQQVGGGGYNRQGQGQGQQNYGGNPGYANFYQQQSVGGGMSSLEQQHQQQNTRDGAAQGQQQPKQQQQQSQQMWQNGY